MESASPNPKPEKTQRRGKVIRFWIATVVTLLAMAAGTLFGFNRYRTFRLGSKVRGSFAAGQYETARTQLKQWLDHQPGSGEAQYYKAWDALAQNQPREAVEAIDRARKLGYDSESLDCLTAIYHARADRYREAEPVLERAFLEQAGPREMVAKELAKIYLMSYRMDQAARAIERWRVLAPQDPEPCLWSNEIASRSNAETAVLIQNYRAALDRDPNLDKARLGLAQELSKDRRFEEAKEEFEAYLKRRPKDTTAFLGLGRNAFQQGKIEDALRYWETAFQTNPRDPETLKELGQLDLRLGRVLEACKRLKLLSEIEPYDHEVRYSYAQALKLAGNPDQAKKELEQATRLRKERDQIIQLRYIVLKNPSDLDTRFQIAKWMMEHGREDEGLKWTKEILRANPRHAQTHGTLADYYSKHGQPGLANFHRLSARDEPPGESR
jgi:tetratricopeptide (TPR) repeat protein